MSNVFSEVLYSNKGIRLVKDVIKNSGSTKEYIYIKKQNAVLVVAVHDHNIVFVRQERHIVDSVSLELPGGRIEINESPVEAAKRELEEETGLSSPDNIKLLGEFFPLLSVTDEKVYVYLMDGLKIGKQKLDETEIGLAVKIVPVNSLKELCSHNMISGPDMLAIHMYLEYDKQNNK